MKRAAGRSGSAGGGVAVNDSRSTNAGKTAVGSTPSSRTCSALRSETHRTASARRTATRATASAIGESRNRNGDP